MGDTPCGIVNLNESNMKLVAILVALGACCAYADNWGVIVVGSKGYMNYRHHADGVGNVAMPNGPMLKNTELVATLKSMHDAKMYKKLVFYMEACESGSMFATLPSGLNIYATTAANAKESSWGTYCSPYDIVDGKKMNTCLGDLYSVNWMEDSDKASSMSSETLEQQFQVVRKETNKSHCLEFGDVAAMSSLPIHDFQAEESGVFGLRNSTGVVDEVSAETKLRSAVDSRDIGLVSLFSRYLESGSGAQALIEEIQMREKAKSQFSQIAALALGPEASPEALQGMGELTSTQEWDCHHKATDAVEAACGRFNDYTLKFIATVANLCKAGASASNIAKAAQQVC